MGHKHLKGHNSTAGACLQDKWIVLQLQAYAGAETMVQGPASAAGAAKA